MSGNTQTLRQLSIKTNVVKRYVPSFSTLPSCSLLDIPFDGVVLINLTDSQKKLLPIFKNLKIGRKI